MTPEGILTDERLSENEWKDIAFGWKIAKRNRASGHRSRLLL